MPEQFDEGVLNERVLETGNAVGDLAMGYYGRFIEVPFRQHGKNRMLEDTQRFLREAREGRGPVNIAEASFDFDGNFCSVDILRVEDAGVHIVEVKSSTHLNDIYLHDMAYQTWVLQQCGLNVLSTSLMHVNASYVRAGELDLHQLFTVEDHTEDMRAMVPHVADRVTALKTLADGEGEPDIPIGCYCEKPYRCGYRAWCWRDVPQPSVFDLNRMGMATALRLHEQGITTLSDVAREAGLVSGDIDRKLNRPLRLSARKRVQELSFAEGMDCTVDKEKVRAFLDGLRFPLYFLDFETMQPAVPPFDGVRPYQQIPTQYSLHVLAAPDAELEHREFLAEAGGDPRRAVAEHLVADIPVDACTLAYNMSFEKGRIRELAEAFPDLADHLLAINEGMDDLMKPFAAGDCYFSAMGGSNSIKQVLPALFPDDAELDYHRLEGVHNGSEAMAAFEDLGSMSADEVEQVREQLLRYCELDTLAMVRIWEKLCELAV